MTGWPAGEVRIVDAIRLGEHAVLVQAAQATEHLFHLVGERLVGGVLVGEHGVAATLGQDACRKDSNRGRRGLERGVVMPRFRDRLFLADIGDAEDRRIAVHLLGVRRYVDLAPAAREVEQLAELRFWLRRTSTQRS